MYVTHVCDATSSCLVLGSVHFFSCMTHTTCLESSRTVVIIIGIVSPNNVIVNSSNPPPCVRIIIDTNSRNSIILSVTSSNPLNLLCGTGPGAVQQESPYVRTTIDTDSRQQHHCKRNQLKSSSPPLRQVILIQEQLSKKRDQLKSSSPPLWHRSS